MAGNIVFIDTNILLDFYRARGKDARLSVLGKIDQHHNVIITGDQVQMEFKKNRQSAILESYRAIKPEMGGLAPPLFLAESKNNKGLQSTRKRLETQAQRLKVRLAKVLQEPARNDPVYKVCQRLFRNKSPLNLSREKDIRLEIRELATKRFLLGYPPRKDSDTSIGDAINWEWIIRCAIESGSNVLLVSRDSDYGSQFDGQPVLNDWLREEFKSRVSKKRRIVLTERLTEAFKAASIKISKEEEAAESALINDRREQAPIPPQFSGSGGITISPPAIISEGVLKQAFLGDG